MRALTAAATVRSDHILTLHVPADIPPGVHQIVVVLEDSPLRTEQETSLADWPTHNVGLTDPTMTFHREDLYGDDGR